MKTRCARWLRYIRFIVTRLRAVAVKIAASDVTTGGLVGDRQWVLVNQDGIVNRKKLPTLRFLDIALEQDRMTLSLKGAGRQADFADSEMSGDVVSIGRQVACEHAAEPVNRWLSQAFGQPLSLVRAVEAESATVDGNAVLGVARYESKRFCGHCATSDRES